MKTVGLLEEISIITLTSISSNSLFDLIEANLVGQRNSRKCDLSPSNLSFVSLRLRLYIKIQSDEQFFSVISFISIVKLVVFSTREKWPRQLACQPASIFQCP